MPIITFYLPQYPGEVEAGGCLNVQFLTFSSTLNLLASYYFTLFYPILPNFADISLFFWHKKHHFTESTI